MELPNIQEPATSRGYTFGEKLVGLDFNPSGDAKVNRVKQLCAELADIVMEDYATKDATRVRGTLHDPTMAQILIAQMMAVKLLTLKH